ncbi:proteinase-activated receptor 1 [Paramormyrops kingsleyae]|uniref:proteinase-activated receptor 1 n=1 Tax=Paramormyrops kingsleyae TaxID=1676925 RepID=UPI003B96A723
MLKLLVFSAYIALHSATSLSTPSSPTVLPRVRSFQGFLVTSEPIDYGDSSEDTGLAVPKPKFNVTKEVKEYLTGPLLTVFVPSIYTLVFIISIPLNTAAILLFIGKIRPSKPAGIYMINLAVADLLFVSLLSFRISYHFNGNDWVFGSAMCRIVTSAFFLNMYCSILLIMCISVDRYVAVVYPIKSLMWRSPLKAAAACGLMWFLASVGVTPLLMSKQDLHLTLNITTCHDVLDVNQMKAFYVYFFTIFTSIFFFVPLIVTTFCYVRIIQTLCSTSTVKHSKRTRAIVMAVIVLIIFVACFAPTNVVLFTHYLQFTRGSSEQSYMAYLLSVCIGSINCCLDPLIYYFGSSQCQKQVAGILRCKAAADRRRASEYTSSSKMDTFQVNISDPYKKLMT